IRQLIDRTLQRRLLRFEGRQGLIALGLGLADDVGGFLLGALDEFVALALTFGHVLTVDALSQSDETVGIPVAAGCGGTEADAAAPPAPAAMAGACAPDALESSAGAGAASLTTGAEAWVSSTGAGAAGACSSCGAGASVGSSGVGTAAGIA